MAIREESCGNNRRWRHFKSADIAGAVASNAALVGRQTDSAVAGVNRRAVLQQGHGQGGAAVVGQRTQSGIGVIQAANVGKVAT